MKKPAKEPENRTRAGRMGSWQNGTSKGRNVGSEVPLSPFALWASFEVAHAQDESRYLR
jgi:hypothetical protein